MGNHRQHPWFAPLRERKCSECAEVFTARRWDAQLCSPKCRKRRSRRRRSVTDPEKSERSDDERA